MQPSVPSGSSKTHELITISQISNIPASSAMRYCEAFAAFATRTTARGRQLRLRGMGRTYGILVRNTNFGDFRDRSRKLSSLYHSIVPEI